MYIRFLNDGIYKYPSINGIKCKLVYVLREQPRVKLIIELIDVCLYLSGYIVDHVGWISVLLYITYILVCVSKFLY
jgi:hypothetical protein